jgi:hypothetical protein
MTILVGCSGWSYDDWIGGFYPVELTNKKGAWFDYYAQYFSTVEINSTYLPTTCRTPSQFLDKEGQGQERLRIFRKGSPALHSQGIG